MHIASFMKIHWYSSYHPKTKIQMGSFGQISLVRSWQNLPTGNPKPDSHNINAHTKFHENSLIFTELLTLYMLGKNFSRWYIEIFFLFFIENWIWHFMKIVSYWDNLHEVLEPAESSHSVVSVNKACTEESFVHMWIMFLTIPNYY